MPIRFRKSFKIFPWFKINVSKSGISETVGSKGFHLTFSKRGVRQSIGLPGTGLSESSYILQNEQRPAPLQGKAEQVAQAPSGLRPSPPFSADRERHEDINASGAENGGGREGAPGKLVLIFVGLIGVACICLAVTMFGFNPLQGISQWIASLHL